MQLGVSTGSFYGRWDVEQAIPLLGEMGVSRCEVFLSTRSEYQPAFLAMLQRRLSRAGLTVTSVHPLGTQFEPQFFSGTIRQKRDAYHIFCEAFAAARALGAKRYVLHGPANLKGGALRLNFASLAERADILAEQAHREGVQLTWENVSWCYFERPSFASELLSQLKSPHLGFTFDVKQAVQTGQPLMAYLDAMGERLANVHICDMDGAGRPCLPGQGEVDFPELARRLRQMGYTGPVMLEVYGENYRDLAQLREGFDRMAQVFG
ncbi:MAG: sugar phosphate isomerase/epimerase family protein [Christensenellales bacterium]|jgi:sugar phosphate isomerase/epimerase